MEIKEIPIEKISPNPLQPRESFDKEKIKELANSIKESDLLQPIVVRKINGNYQIVCGERRWRAFGFLKKKTIPSIVWDIKDDIDTLEKSVIENWHRLDLTDSEKEKVINELWNSKRYKTQREMSRKTGIPLITIQRIIKAKEERKDLKLIHGNQITYRDISRTTKLKEKPRIRKQLLEKRTDDKILAMDLEKTTKILANQDEEIAEETLQRLEKKERIIPEMVKETIHEVKLDREMAEMKEKYAIEIPTELKKANFVIDFSKKCSTLSTYFQYCNKIPKEVWERAFTGGQLLTIRNSAVDLMNKLRDFLDILGVYEE